MPKNNCPKFNELKDIRAKHCRNCIEFPRPRNGKTRFHKKTGYMTIMIDGVCMYEHRYLMEQKLGRKLERREHVHHINGNRTDNRLINLELLDASEHAKEHMTYEKAKAASILGHKARWGDKNSYVSITLP